MKKLILLAILALLGCKRSDYQITSGPNQKTFPKLIEERANENWNQSYSLVDATDYKIGGMKYKIFSTSSQGGIFVVNVTKDSLEVVKLLKEK